MEDSDPAPPAAPLTHDRDHRFEGLEDATIMMVDDEPTTMEVLEMFLQEEGYSRFVTTADSTQALTLLRTHNPDVLLLDLMMPKPGGLEILAAMRQDEALEHTPVLILTSSTDAETKLKALELGATDFLGKPVDPSELALRLRNTLAAKAYRDRLTYYDGLTGLPNRRLCKDRLERFLVRAQSKTTPCAIFHINLDRFKQINDGFGHEIGDALLKLVADRLDTCVRPQDFVGTPRDADDESMLSRVGGDEFLLFLSAIDSAGPAARIARRIQAKLAEPFQVGGRELFLSSSIGIALCPEDGDDVESLLGHAGIALSHAKRRGRNDYQFYSESLNVDCLERLGLENRLRGAIERDELELHYQPKVDLQTGRIVGAEALMRWKHPELGFVPPDRFIPLAEESDLIGSLGAWALRTACAQTRAWQQSGHAPIRVAVNVSSKQFRLGNLLQAVEGAIQASALDPRHLVLELTESMIMENSEATSKILHQLKALGVKLSVDDFGTGYSSLSNLKRFPLDELKIDCSFVKGVPSDADDAAIVTAIVQMARALGLVVVAEGVETEEQLEFLRERGCDQYQGYYCSKAVPAAEWAGLISGRL